MKKTATTLLALFALLSFAVLAAADHAGTEREATFIGSSHIEHDLNEACEDALEEEECPARVPQGIISVVCDNGDGHPYTAGLYDGIGGVSFCDIPKEQIIEMQFVDTVSPTTPSARITCPTTDPDDPDAVQWNRFFGYLQGEAPVQFEVPDWCDETGDDDHPGTTQVNGFLQTASMTQEGVFLPLEGEISLSY